MGAPRWVSLVALGGVAKDFMLASFAKALQWLLATMLWDSQ
jgi:hypothetical protein